GGGTVADEADGNGRRFAQLEGIGDARRVRGLGADRNAEGEVVRRPRREVAAFVAAPVEQDLLHLDAAPDEGAVVAIGRQQHVLRAHGAGDADRYRLL